MKKPRALTRIFFYIVIVFLGYLFYDPPGDPLQVPLERFSVKPGGWVVFQAVYESRTSKNTYLIVSKMECQGLEIVVNGGVTFKIGGPGSPAKLWTDTFAVPVELKKGKNVIVIKAWSVYSVNVVSPVTISDKPWGFVLISRLLNSWLPVLSVSVLWILGSIYILASRRIMEESRALFFEGLASISAGCFSMYFASTPNLIHQDLYLTLNTVFLAFAILMISFYYASMEALLGSTRSWKWVVIAGLITSMVISIEKDFDNVVKLMEWIVMPTGAVLIAIAGVRLARGGLMDFSISAFITSASTVHYSLSLLFSKPFHPILLYGIFQNFAIFTRHLARSYEKAKITALEAYRDPLTGVYNRRIIPELDLRSGDSIIFFDVDDFKIYNDSHGHDFGDKVLRDLAEIITRNVKGKDFVIRYGGDEFLVIMKECSGICPKLVAEEISDEFERRTGLGVSYGISEYRGNLNEAIAFADAMMYRMKREKKVSD